MNSTNVYIKTINISGLKKVPKYRKKCEHGKQRSECKQCGARDAMRTLQKPKRIYKKCKHDKRCQLCVVCGGSSICKHSKRRSTCKECCGSSICKHGRQRPSCIMCSNHPLIECTFPFCNYKTKVQQNYDKHVKIHSEEYIKKCKLEEIKIEKLLVTNKIDYTREHTVSYSCVQDIENRNSRIDFVIEHTDVINKKYGLLFLEVDEHQHESYPVPCEISRMTKVIESLRTEGNELPIRFIRYNPHSFSVNNVKQRINQNDRHSRLIEYIKTCTFDTDFSVKYLFYDEYDDKPAIFFASEYNEHFKQFVI